MLEGLEITIKNLKGLNDNNPTYRLDSEFYKKEYLLLFKKLFKKPCVKLETISSLVTQGPNPIFSESEIPCLTGRNISKGRVNYNNADYISEIEYKNLKRFQIKFGDTLITLKGKGSIGKIGYVTDKRKAIFSRDIGVIRPSRIDSAYVNAYLLSKIGARIIGRGETGGTGQSTLTASYLKNIDIPRLGIEKEIGSLILSSEEILINSASNYAQAESTLFKEIGLQNVLLSKDQVNIKSFKESFCREDRIDSEYYLLKYEQLRENLRSYKFGCENLGVISNTFRGNFVPEEFYNMLNGIKYIRGADISSNQLASDKLMKLSNGFKHSNELLTEKGDIVIALIGSVGTASLITENYTKSIISNNLGLIRVHDQRFNPIYIHMFLTHNKIGQLLFKQKEMRTAQPKISDKDILDFPIPILDFKKQELIAELVEESFKQKVKSERLIEVAKKAVEMAIEEGEEVAKKFISNQKAL